MPPAPYALSAAATLSVLAAIAIADSGAGQPSTPPAGAQPAGQPAQSPAPPAGAQPTGQPAQSPAPAGAQPAGQPGAPSPELQRPGGDAAGQLSIDFHRSNSPEATRLLLLELQGIDRNWTRLTDAQANEYIRYSQDREQFEQFFQTEVRRVIEAGSCPQGMTPEQYVRLRMARGELHMLEFLHQEMETSRTPGAREIERRVHALQEASRRIARSLGILDFRISVENLPAGTEGLHRNGTNEIVVPLRDLVHYNAATGNRLRATIAHELVHHEQDVLIVRSIAQRLREQGVNLSTPEGRRQLADQYFSRTLCRLNDSFAQQIVARYAGRTLNEGQMARADALAESTRTWTRDELLRADRFNVMSARLASAGQRPAELAGILADLQSPSQREFFLGTESAVWLQQLRQRLERSQLSPEQAIQDAIQELLERVRNTRNAQFNQNYRQILHEREAWYVDNMVMASLAEHEGRSFPGPPERLTAAAAVRRGEQFRLDSSDAAQQERAREVLADFNRAAGPETEQGRALLRLLTGDTSATADATRRLLESQLGQENTRQFLERLAGIVAGNNMTEAQARVFIGLVDGNRTPGPAGLREMLHTAPIAALENAASLVSGEHPAVTSANLRAFRELLRPNGSINVREVLAQANPDALARLASLAGDSHPTAQEFRSSETFIEHETAGHRHQRWLYNGLMQTMQEPGRAGEPSLFAQGWRIVPTAANSTADRAGIDFVLVNLRTGQWLPLDVSERQKNRRFSLRYNIGDFFERRTGVLTDGARLNDWLRSYLDSSSRPGFDISQMPPPPVASDVSAAARETNLNSFSDQLRAERERLNEEYRNASAARRPQSELDRISNQLRGLDSLLEEHVARARGHLNTEVQLHNLAVDALRRFLETRREHFVNNRTRSGHPVEQPLDRQGILDERIYLDRSNELSAQNQSGESTYHLGSIRELINQAIDSLNLPAADREAIRANLAAYRFGEGGAAMSAEERLICEELFGAARRGLADNWTELSRELTQRAAAQLDTVTTRISEACTSRFVENVSRAMYDRCFRLNSTGAVESIPQTTARPADAVSLADLIRRYQEIAADPTRAAELPRAQRNVELALGMRPFRAIQISSMSEIFSGYPPQLRTALEQATFQIDSSVAPGDPRVTYHDTAGRQIRSFGSYNSTNNQFAVTFSDGTQGTIRLENVRVRIAISSQLDPLTVPRDLFLGRSNAALDLTREIRLQEAHMTSPADRAEVEHVDRTEQQRLRDTLLDPRSEINRQQLQDLAAEIRAAWQEAGSAGHPTPGAELDVVLEIAADHLHNRLRSINDEIGRAANDAERARLIEQRARLEACRDLLARYRSEAAMPTGSLRPTFESLNSLLVREDLTFLRGTRLSAAEAERIRQELAQLGPNRLTEQSMIQRFVDGLLQRTRQWSEDLRPLLERQQQLQQRRQTAQLSVRTAAYAEAHHRLGPDANAEAVRQYAEGLISGERQAAENSAVAIARRALEGVTQEHTQVTQRLHELTTARAAHLQTAVNEFCRANNLPEVQINIVDTTNGADGHLNRGRNVIDIPRSALLDRAAGITAIRAIYHELQHREQDVLIVRLLADRANVNSITATDADFDTLRRAYREATGGELARDFLNLVLRARREGRNSPERLTPEQVRRAERLAQGLNESAATQNRVEELGNMHRLVLSERAALSGPLSNRAAEQLIQRLLSPQGEQLALRMFGTANRAQWPQAIRQLVQAWENAPKDARGQVVNFDEARARELFQEQMGQRVQQLSNELRTAYDRYRNSLHEQEAHLVGSDVERLTQREFFDAVTALAPAARQEHVRIGAAEAATLRGQAHEGGVSLGTPERVSEFVRDLTSAVLEWRDDLTAQWESGAERRANVQEAFERAIAVARERLRASGVNSAQLERQARQMVENPSPQLLADAQFREARNQYLGQREQYFGEFGALHEVILARQQQLQAQMDRYTSERGVPRVRVQLSEFSGTAGSGYDRGAGTLTVNAQDLLSRGHGQHLMSTIGRQLTISQQDALIVRSIIDGVNQQVQPLSTEQLNLVRERYRAQTGSELAPAFLAEVVARRNRVLTPTEQARAQELATSFRESRLLAVEAERAAQDLAAVERESARLRQSQRPASELMQRLMQPGSEALCQHLFGVRNINELAPNHPARTLIERYRQAAVGGLMPLAECAQWSESQASRELAQLLETRERALRHESDRLFVEYTNQRHVREAAVIAHDIDLRAGQETDRLTQSRSGDGQQREFQAAQRAVEARRNETRFLDLVQARLREQFPQRAMQDMTPREIDGAIRTVLAELDGAIGNVEIMGEQMSAHDAQQRAEAGRRLFNDFSRALAALPSDTQARAVIERVRQYISPPAATPGARDLDLLFDPLPSAHELARLGNGRPVLEVTQTGVRLRREGGAEEWSSDRIPSREEIERALQREIERLEELIRERERQGQPVRTEERALLDAYRQTREALRTANAEQLRALEGNARGAFRGTRAMAGSAIGIAIIASAALGWYIRMQGGQRPANLGSIHIPGC